MPELNAADKELVSSAAPDCLDAPVKTAGYEVKVDREKCKGCQMCVFYCPAHHLAAAPELNRRGQAFVLVCQETKCSGCGFCFLMCPDSCIEISGE